MTLSPMPCFLIAMTSPVRLWSGDRIGRSMRGAAQANPSFAQTRGGPAPAPAPGAGAEGPDGHEHDGNEGQAQIDLTTDEANADNWAKWSLPSSKPFQRSTLRRSAFTWPNREQNS